MASETNSQIPIINFSGLSSNHPRTTNWDSVSAQVMQALGVHTCFLALHDQFPPELTDTLLGTAAAELFNLPEDVKSTNTSDVPNRGYARPVAGQAYESLAIEDAHLRECTQRFTTRMWPHGNPVFSDAVCSFAKQLIELEKIVVRMILENLGINEKYYHAYIESAKQIFRLNAYAPQSPERTVGLPEHTDHNMITIISPGQVPGLQIHTEEEHWVCVTPHTNAFVVLIGDAFEAWSNGRLQATRHRVMMQGGKTRYSALQASYPKDGLLVRAPMELVDEDHPLLFKPYYHNEFLRFCFSEAGLKSISRLRAFCGLGDHLVEA